MDGRHYMRKISHGLVLLSVLSFCHARSVKPITFGYELGSPANDLLSLAPDQELDLSISAAEPRPVFVELVKRPLSLPLVAEAPVVSAGSVAAPVLSASEKIEKVLRRPMAFSYNNDQANAESSVIINSPKETLRTDESQRLDQQPQAIDYYKYIASLRGEEKDSGAGAHKENTESKKEEKSSLKEEGEKGEGKKHKSDIFLSYSPSNFHREFAGHSPVGFHKHGEKPKSEETHKEEESKKSKSVDHGNHHHNFESLFTPKFKLDDGQESKHVDHHVANHDIGGKAEASESHEEHKIETHHSGDGGHSDSHESSSDAGKKHEEAKEEVQASASHHGGGEGGGGNFKKGGSKEYKSEIIGEHAKDGEKKYIGKHHHEKGEKGHKDKLGHIVDYKEAEGEKHGHHDEDGYEAENHHGEDGKRGTEFHEEGEHSKGHSTQGEHNVHKKDEYEKKHEFYDESHEGGEHDKHGEYFHEDDYHKGGHHKAEHKKGGAHEEHYGEKKKHEEGGHEHEDQGHKKADGHDIHHHHQEKEGSEGGQKDGKSFKYDHGQSEKKGEDNKGSHQHVQEIVKFVKIINADGTAEASDHGKAEDSKGADYLVREISIEKKSHEDDQGDNKGHKAEATEEYGNHDAEHEHNHEAYDNHRDLGALHGHEKRREQADDEDHYNSRLEGGHEHNAEQQKEENRDEKHPGYDNFGYYHEAEARPQKVEKEPEQDKKNAYGGESFVRLLHDQARAEDPRNHQNQEHLHPHAEGLHADGSHAHPNGYICPGGGLHTYEDQKTEEPTRPEADSHGQGEESAPGRHILVLGNDGKIYSVLSNEDSIDNTRV